MRYKELRHAHSPHDAQGPKELAEARRAARFGTSRHDLVTQVQEAPVRGQAKVEARLEHLRDGDSGRTRGSPPAAGAGSRSLSDGEGGAAGCTRLLYKKTNGCSGA